MTSLAMPARIIQFGCGGVGIELVKQIINLQKSKRPYVPIIAIADSKTMIISNTGFLDIPSLQWIVKTKELKASLDCMEGVTVKPLAEGIELLLNGTHSSFQYILADCTASDTIGETLASAISAGALVAMANKKPITASMELFKRLTVNPKNVRVESTCGAGMPIITTVNRIVRSGDPVSKMAGALSGTLGYVMSGLEAGQAFSTVVTEAKAQGFTEPDPRDDLSGLDVARKALILARHIGWSIEMEDVKVESLFSESMGPDKMSVDEFMTTGLKELDDSIKAKVAAAAAKGEVLRYAATVEDGKCAVGLVSVAKASPLGGLSGTDNLFELHSDCYSPNPLVIQGRGAGAAATASGVLADILELSDTISLGENQKVSCVSGMFPGL